MCLPWGYSIPALNLLVCLDETCRRLTMSSAQLRCMTVIGKLHNFSITASDTSEHERTAFDANATLITGQETPGSEEGGSEEEEHFCLCRRRCRCRGQEARCQEGQEGQGHLQSSAPLGPPWHCCAHLELCGLWCTLSWLLQADVRLLDLPVCS